MPASLPTGWNARGYVYFLTNKRRTTLYIGVTSNLFRRIQQHREGKYPNSFTARYPLNRLVHYEVFTGIEVAINREKEVKKWRREKKDNLILKANPNWEDLAVKDYGLDPI